MEWRMPHGESTPKLGSVETLLLKLDIGALGAFYRIAIGFATVPIYNLLFGELGSNWNAILFFLGVLALLRLGTAVIRKLIPMSAELREAWSLRRRMAKYYDSYQWRKLTWFGIGLGLYQLFEGQSQPPYEMIALFCLLSGFAGMLTWHAVAADSSLPKPTAKKIKRPA
jgi:hypothetical protein